jgi:hypothetical protein
LLLGAVFFIGSGTLAQAEEFYIKAYPNCDYQILGPNGCAVQALQSQPTAQTQQPATTQQTVTQPTKTQQTTPVKSNVQTQPVCKEAVNVSKEVQIQIPKEQKPCKVEVKTAPVPKQLPTVIRRYERIVEDWGPYKKKSPADLLAIMKNLITNFPAPKQTIENAPANCCYGMLVRPPIYKEVVVEYVKHDPIYKIKVTQPQFNETYKTFKVLVRPEYYEKVCENATYVPKNETIQLSPPSFKLVEKNGIICKVQTPGKEVTVTRYVLKTPAKCKTIYHPPVYATVKVPVYELVQNATCNCTPGKPITAEVTDRYMVEGPKVIWDAVLCDINLKPEEIKLIQQKLKELGYYNGPINGLLDEKTMEAVVKFQVDHNLPAGNISIQTLEALGLNQLAKNYVACELRK